MQHFKSLFLFPIIALIAIILVNCQENPTTVAPENQSPELLNKFSLGAGESLISAHLFINLAHENNQTINIHRVTSDWQEMVVTWNSFGSAFNNGTIEGSFLANLPVDVYKSADITGLVSAWLMGTQPNYGMLLDQVTKNYPRATYYSREFPEVGYNPYLELVVSTSTGNVIYTLPAIADTYIYENFPDANYGNSEVLYTGWLNEVDKEKQTLLKFDLGTADCETAYAYFNQTKAHCFSEYGFSNWGWSNGPLAPGTTETFNIYAGAGICDITKGTMVGTLSVSYSGSTATITYNITAPYILNETHLYVGNEPLPRKRGVYTTAPGQFPYSGQSTYTISGLSGNIYVVAHSVVCGNFTD